MPMSLKCLKWYIKSLDDIINYKDYLKYQNFNLNCYKYLLRLLLVSQNKILVKTDGAVLLILRSVVRHHTFELDRQGRNLVFKVFKKYIFHKSKKISTCANRLMLGIVLNNTEIKWLIENVDKSPDILNRLLRYPKYNKLIAEWAIKVFNDDSLKKRKSELLGKIIYSDVPLELKYTDRELIWGIYYSKRPDKIKKKMLNKVYNSEYVDDFIKVCKRLGYYDVLDLKIGELIHSTMVKA